MRLLLIEDDVEMACFIRDALLEEGHDLEVAPLGEPGLARAEAGKFDVVIVDRLLPDLPGTVLVERLRAGGDVTPVLMLTALGSIEDRVVGLGCGADDYLVKPFAMAELSARLAALARRGGTIIGELASVGALRLDRLKREVWRDGRRVVLQPREFELLDQLVRQAGRVVSRAMLLEQVWHFHFDPQTNIVETHMSRLRQKLNAGSDQDLIQTVRGVGYRLRTDG
ncbi:response regulator transcription factor [Croceibacterium ferulae]|uniref:response regulator transcription factor n=1 Tax=Croceibacterium ferulae TaxID=1854641 RepID=UPI000EB151D5|nr:response regulator transcription factor [Croceibacterium ferulae]